MDLQCHECRRIWLDFARATDELFTINSNLQSTRLPRDDRDVVQLRLCADAQVRRRDQLRFEFDAHQAGAHGVDAQETRIVINNDRQLHLARKDRSCYP